MTLSDALTHRDEPSAVLDSASRVDQREMNEGGCERDGDGCKRDRRKPERERRAERERGRDRYRRFPVSCHVLRRAFELYEETPSMNYSWPSSNDC